MPRIAKKKRKNMQTCCNTDCDSKTQCGMQLHMEKLIDTVTHTSARIVGIKTNTRKKKKNLLFLKFRMFT